MALDQRARGLSDKPDNTYSRDHYVQDVIAAMDRLDLGPDLIIGHSTGALNGWALAGLYPHGYAVYNEALRTPPRRRPMQKPVIMYVVPL